MSSYNAIIFKTPDNNAKNNIKAVSTLKDRLNEIKNMSPTSFEYQTAIQQITAQEQGEATEMIDTLEGCWLLENYPYVWGWIGLLIFLVGLIAILIGFACITIND